MSRIGKYLYEIELDPGCSSGCAIYRIFIYPCKKPRFLIFVF